MSTASINKTPFLWCQFYDCILQASSLLAIKLNSIYEWQPWLVLPHSNILIIYSLWSASPPVWPDWATFWSLWQQLICPNLPHSLAIFVKVSKSIIFLVKSFWATFMDIWQYFSGHTDRHILKLHCCNGGIHNNITVIEGHLKKGNYDDDDNNDDGINPLC